MGNVIESQYQEALDELVLVRRELNHSRRERLELERKLSEVERKLSSALQRGDELQAQNSKLREELQRSRDR